MTYVLAMAIILMSYRFPMPKSEYENLNKADFVMYLIFALECSSRIYTYKPKYLLFNLWNLMDLICLTLNTGDYIFVASKGLNIFLGESIATGAFRSMKLIRIFRILYELSAFETLSVLIKALGKTFEKIKHFLLMLIPLIAAIGLIGVQLFAFRVRFMNSYEIPVKKFPQ